MRDQGTRSFATRFFLPRGAFEGKARPFFVDGVSSSSLVLFLEMAAKSRTRKRKRTRKRRKMNEKTRPDFEGFRPNVI